MHLVRLERDGQLRIIGMSNEPDCWATIAGYELKPDLYMELERAGLEQRLKVWFEVDMATEGQRQIKEKLVRYWQAFNAADATVWPVFPVVIFAAIDQHRAQELSWFIEQGPKEALPLFRVVTIDNLSTAFA